MKKTILLLIAASAILNCGKFDKKFRAHTRADEKIDTDPDPNNTYKVCFASTCLATTADISNSRPNEYKYDDPYQSPNFPSGAAKSQYLPPARYLDLNVVDNHAQLSKNFSLSEFVQIQKGQYGLFSPAAIEKIQAMRDALKKAISIHSGYRSPSYNGNTSGSAQWSRHMYGDGVDFSVSGVSFKNLQDLCLKNGASFTQLYTAHIHCDWRRMPLNGAFYPPTTQPADYVVVKAEAEAATKIAVATVNEGLRLYIDTTYVEDDPEELIYEWQITSPSGVQTTSGEAQPLLGSEQGDYQVRVNVGGSIEVSQQIHIE